MFFATLSISCQEKCLKRTERKVKVKQESIKIQTALVATGGIGRVFIFLPGGGG